MEKSDYAVAVVVDDVTVAVEISVGNLPNYCYFYYYFVDMMMMKTTATAEVEIVVENLDDFLRLSAADDYDDYHDDMEEDRRLDCYYCNVW